MTTRERKLSFFVALLMEEIQEVVQCVADRPSSGKTQHCQESGAVYKYWHKDNGYRLPEMRSRTRRVACSISVAEGKLAEPCVRGVGGR